MSRSNSGGNEPKRPAAVPPRRLNIVSQLVSDKANSLDITATKNHEALNVPLGQIEPNQQQPRRFFDKERDQELAHSIEENGVLEPIIVREMSEGRYEIVAGERRYQASKLLGLKTIPVIVKDYDDKKAQFVSVVENLQRVDLDPQDEARYFKTLCDNYNYSYREIADMIHRSPTYVNDRIKLLSGGTTTRANDSEKSNKHSENERKLQKSQLDGVKEKEARTRYTVKPLASFDQWLNKTHEQLVTLKPEEKTHLREMLSDLRQKIAELEKDLP